MSVKPYSKYKDSETKWLGHLPTEWRIAKLGSMFIERKEKVSDKEYPPLSVTKNGIFPQLESAAKTNDGDNRKKVCEGDFVINSRSDRKGSSGLSALTGSVSLISTVLQPNGNVNRYSHYLLKSQPFQEEFYRVGHGIVADLWTTKFSEMRTILMPVPSSKEQLQIAKYLDWKTSQINRFIKAKRRQIELLQEQKQVIIFDAVTGKIDVRNGKPYPIYKDSGVKSIGELPNEWNTTKLRRTCNVYSGGTPSKDVASYWTKGTIPWLASGEVNKRKIIESETYISEEGFRKSSAKWIPSKSLVVALAGQGKTKGMVATIENQMTGNQSLAAIVPQKNIINYQFLAYYLEAMYKYIRGLVGDELRDGLNLEHIKSIPIPIVPIQMQDSIVTFLDKKSSMLEISITKTKAEIDLLLEYHTRLLADTVTGKVDVRDIKVPYVDSEFMIEGIDDAFEAEEIQDEATVHDDL